MLIKAEIVGCLYMFDMVSYLHNTIPVSNSHPCFVPPVFRLTKKKKFKFRQENKWKIFEVHAELKLFLDVENPELISTIKILKWCQPYIVNVILRNELLYLVPAKTEKLEWMSLGEADFKSGIWL